MTRQLPPDLEAGDDPPPEPGPGPHHLRPAGWGLVGAATVAGMLLGWLAITALRLADLSLPVTPWTMSLTLGLAGAAAIVWSARLPDLLGPVPALTLGRTMLLTGLIVAGAHVSYAAAQLGALEVPLFRRRALAAAAAVVAGVVFALGGWRLERACRVGGS